MATYTVQSRAVVRGVDVSDWQNDVDHQAVKNSGVSFLVAKATEGTRFTARTYRKNRDGSLAAGLVFGAYHWLKPNQDAGEQARWFLAATNNGQGCAFLVLDAEEAGITDEQVTTWCSIVAGTGKPVVIYCGAFTDPKDRSQAWVNYTPWLAAYPSTAENPDPASLKPARDPHPWGHWKLWQYSSSGRVPGIQGLCDVNVADADWFASITTPATPTPVPEDDEMAAPSYIKRTSDGVPWLIYPYTAKRKNLATLDGVTGQKRVDALKYVGVEDQGQTDGNADWMILDLNEEIR